MLIVSPLIWQSAASAHNLPFPIEHHIFRHSDSCSEPIEALKLLELLKQVAWESTVLA